MTQCSAESDIVIALTLKFSKNKMSYVQISYCTQSTEFVVLWSLRSCLVLLLMCFKKNP